MEPYIKVSERWGRFDGNRRDDFSSPEGDSSYTSLSPNIPHPGCCRGQRVIAVGSHLVVTVDLFASDEVIAQCVRVYEKSDGVCE